MPLPAKTPSQSVLGEPVPGISDVKVCVDSSSSVTGEPQVKNFDGCGNPCFAVVVRDLFAEVNVAVSVAYSLDGEPQDAILVSRGPHQVDPPGDNLCVYSIHDPGTPDPCVDGISTPDRVTAAGGKGRIKLAWTKSYTFGESEIGGYEIWRSETGEDGTFVLASTATETGHLDEGLRRGTTLWYQVVAFDTKGNRSGASSPVSATVR